MEINLFFIVNSIQLGIALAMDAFSVSATNGMNDPKMKFRKMCLVAGMYSFFQFAMPLIGWFCVHTIACIFTKFQMFIPWIALILLAFIGGKMIKESICKKEDEEVTILSFTTLLIQAVATSIDALSVGFTISQYNALMAFVASIIIALVTFVICISGIIIGKKVGTKLSSKAGILGGIILIEIGISIFVKNIFFR